MFYVNGGEGGKISFIFTEKGLKNLFSIKTLKNIQSLKNLYSINEIITLRIDDRSKRNIITI